MSKEDLAPRWWRMLRMNWRERLPPKLSRTPEPSAVMDEPLSVQAFHDQGTPRGSLRPLYHFNALRMSQMTPPGGFVIDVGSGSGQYLRYFADMRPDVRILGFDLSDSMITLGRRMLERAGLTGRVRLTKGDMTTFTAPPKERVHVVSSVFALHQLDNLQQVKKCLQQITRVREEQGAGVWIFDFARPRHPDTPTEYPSLVLSEAPQEHRADLRNSLTAAWSFKELTDAIDTCHMGLFSHEETQLLMGLYQAHYLLPKGLPPREARSLRMDLRIAEIHAQSSLEQITVSLPGRLWSLTKMVGRIGVAAADLGVRGLVAGLLRRGRDSKRVQRGVAQIVTRELGRLKGPMMKLGQIAGQSAPRLSVPMRRSLGTLVDTSATIRGDVVRRIVERELGRPIEDVFSEWSDSAFASGVVAQMHFAVLKDGRPVVVKVRYPGLLEAVKSDLRVLRRAFPAVRMLLGLTNADQVYAEVHTLMLAECDFLREAKNQMAFHRIFEGEEDIIVPKTYLDLSTPEMLVMEHIEGKRFKEFAAEASQEEKNRAGSILWRFAARSLNEFCIFNADPHPGNFLFVNGKVAFIDFGFTKRWTVEFVEQAKRQSRAICANDLEEFSEAMRRLGFVDDESRYDFPEMLRIYRETTTLPWREDRLFRFTDEFAHHGINELVARQTRMGPVRLPEDFVAYTRLFWGLYSVLAQLKAEANWHRILFPMLRHPTHPAPPLDP